MSEISENLQLDTIYQIQATSFRSSNSLAPNIWVDMYACGTNGTPPSSLSDMTLNADDEDIQGYKVFITRPKYICLVQKSGTTTEITTEKLQAKLIGTI